MIEKKDIEWHLIIDDKEKSIYTNKLLYNDDGSDINMGITKTVFKKPSEPFNYERDFVRPFFRFMEWRGMK